MPKLRIKSKDIFLMNESFQKTELWQPLMLAPACQTEGKAKTLKQWTLIMNYGKIKICQSEEMKRGDKQEGRKRNESC